jgi:Tol biopolymer transport system component
MIYFTRFEAGTTSIWRIGALGGNARKVLEAARAPSVSRDGRQLAWLADRPGRQLFDLVVGRVDGANQRTLVSNLAFQTPTAAAWSPDGRQLAYSTGRLFEARNLFVVGIADGRVRQITRFEKSTEGTLAQAWLPDGRHLVVSINRFRNRSHLVRFDNFWSPAAASPR